MRRGGCNVNRSHRRNTAALFAAEIDTVIFDVDGTLLNSQHQLLPSTVRAVRQLIAGGIFVMLATGKTYGSTLSAREAFGLETMGVYVQGLVVCDGKGAVIEQRLLERSIVDSALAVTAQYGFDLVAYSGSRLLTPRATPITATMQEYHEPLPIEVPQLANEPINKLLLLGAQAQLDEVRPRLSAQWSDEAQLVQAVPDMLEVVPFGSSKGATVARIVRRLGRSAERTVAFGDGENDIELLKWARIGVAMGNASAVVKASADFVTHGHDHDGIADTLRMIHWGG